MTAPLNPPLALDRYLAATDRAIADPAALDDLIDVFAPDAVVRLGVEEVRGRAALREFYGAFVAAHLESKHLWNSTVLPDGRQRAEWACVARTADGSVVTVEGLEHATIGADGRIVELRNERPRRR